MKKLLFIYNPNAGKAKIKTALGGIIAAFDRADFEVTVRPTRKKGDAAEILYTDAGKYDRVVVSGGDGTLNEALTGLLKRKREGQPIPDLGYIPAGSTNDFAGSLNIPVHPAAAAKNAAEGIPFRCDAGMFNGAPFVYVAAFGAFTEVSYATSQQMKNALGHFAYILEGVKSLSQIKGIPLTVETGAEVRRGNYLFGMVSNSTSVGGLGTIYEEDSVSLDDGLLEVLLVKEPRSLAEKSELVSDLLWSNLNSRFFTVLNVPQIRIRSERMIPWTLDGEFGGETNDAQIEVLRRGYRILVPKDADQLLKHQKAAAQESE